MAAHGLLALFIRKLILFIFPYRFKKYSCLTKAAEFRFYIGVCSSEKDNYNTYKKGDTA